MGNIKTSGVRYLGSKAKIMPLICEVIEGLEKKEKTLIDVFTGTTRVAQAFKALNYQVVTSDLSWASESYSGAFICNDGDMSHLQHHLDKMNQLEPVNGWLTKNYCDVKGEGGSTIRVWKPKNGMRADAAREYVEQQTSLSKTEKDYLVSCIIFALDKVDNTVGLQQAYLKEWKSTRSSEDMVFKPLTNIPGPAGTHISGDALSIQYPEAEVAYLDPPYTPADYSTYYHIWDSIARWDKPTVGLKTNRRSDRIKSSDKYDTSMKSPWYSARSALDATKSLVDRLPVRYCVFSYSDEGLIKYDEMISMCETYKAYKVYTKQHDRHVMSRIGAGGSDAENAQKKKNTEFVIVIEK